MTEHAYSLTVTCLTQALNCFVNTFNHFHIMSPLSYIFFISLKAFRSVVNKIYFTNGEKNSSRYLM